MYKKYLIALLLSLFIGIPAHAGDSVFSNSKETFELQPLNNVQTQKSTNNQIQMPIQANTELENKNYTSAISNLDNVQVELREQMASYSALMAQAKSNYENKKDEYKAYKKEYKNLKKKMKNIEKTKKIIQNNITNAAQINQY